MESSFQLMIAYDMFYYVKFTALSIETICRVLPLIVLKILASVGVTPRIFPTFTIAQKQEELQSSVLQ